MSNTTPETAQETAPITKDEKLLAALGYKQELNRSWSAFSNFAISFSVISIRTNCNFDWLAIDFRVYPDHWFVYG
jgi:hypothetical protein